jgi:hypothetical protein
MTSAEFCEKLHILTGLMFGGGPAAEAGEPLPPLLEGPFRETLLCFDRALARHRDFLKGLYDIMVPQEASISEGILLLAREQQGVCSYGLDLPSGKVLYLDPAGTAEPLVLSLEDFLLYLTAIQSSGYLPCSGKVGHCRDLLEDRYSDRRLTGAAGEGAVYCFEEGVIIAVAGNDAYASAPADSAMETFERVRSLEVDYF